MLQRLEIHNYRKYDRYAVELRHHSLLVGPNNAGKSTVIEALRLVSVVLNRLGSLNFERPPEWLDGHETAHGVTPSLKGLGFDLGREIFHNYADPPALIRAVLHDGEEVSVYLGSSTDVFAVVRASDGAAVSSKREARSMPPGRLGIQPQVGPLAKLERPLVERYVRSSLDSSLAPSHFRNQLRLLDAYFDDFSRLVEESWPGLAITALEAAGLGDDRHLRLLLRDGAFVGEVGSMGHGLQMWLQLMWFLARSRDDAAIVLDEPDVYMHPDLQRRLIRLLFTRGQQVIVATHSLEMIREVEPEDLVPIDSTRKSSSSPSSVAKLRRVLEQLSADTHNIEYARLGRASRCLAVPPGDLRLLRRWHDLLTDEPDALDLLPKFPWVNWQSWDHVVAMKRVIDQTRDYPIQFICMVPADAMPEHFLESRRGQATQEGIDLVLWGRRQLESYLLDPDLIASRMRQVDVTTPLDAGEIAERLDGVIDTQRQEVRQYVASRWSLGGSIDEDMEAFIEDRWSSIEGRLELVDGRLTLLRFARSLDPAQRAGLSPRDLAASLTAARLNPEIRMPLAAVARGDLEIREGPREAGGPWPVSFSRTRRTQAHADEPVDIIELLVDHGGA